MDFLDIDAKKMTYSWLCGLLATLEETNGVTESPWIEVKSKRHGPNIAEAVAALANADGGLVLVGVLDEKDAKGATGAERVVGVPRSEYENIIMSLSTALGHEVPEVRTIAIEEKPDHIALVILADPEKFEHPVVVFGKVKIRVGSSSTNADRPAIERLVDRNKASQSSGDTVYLVPANQSYVPYWEDTDPPFATIRVATSLLLGRTILDRPVITIEAIDVALRVMKESLVPTALWFMGALFDVELVESRNWDVIKRSARQFRLSVRPKEQGPWPVGDAGAGVIVTLDGQHLEASTTIWFPKSEKSNPLVLSDVYQVLLALLVTTRDLLTGVGESLVPDTITRMGTWRGWIQSDGGQTARELGEILDFGPGTRIAADYTTPAYALPDFRLKEVNIDSFEYLVRLWLDILFADCGVVHHEAALAALEKPFWFGRFQST